MPRRPLIVLGGGISGLVAAHRLRAGGADVVLLEAESRLGGRFHSERVDGYLLEWGPQWLPADGAVAELIEELGASSELRAITDEAILLFRRQRLARFPVHGGALLLGRSVGLRSKLRVMFGARSSRRIREGESVREHYERCLGRGVTDGIVGPALSACCAGLPGELEMRSLVPGTRAGASLAALRERVLGGSRVATLAAGSQDLADRLGNALGPTVRTGLAVQRLEVLADGGWRVTARSTGGDGADETTLDAAGIVCALPADRSARLLRPFAPEAAALLDEIPYASLTIVQLGARTEELARPLSGLGFWVPRHEDLSILGATWASQIAAGRAPTGRELVTVYLGGRGRPELAELPEALIRHKALHGIFAVLGGGFAPDLLRVRRLDAAIPQAVLGHHERVQRLLRALSGHPSLVLAGGYLHGGALAASVETARRAVVGLLDPASGGD